MSAKDLMKYDNWIVIGDVENNEKYASRILAKFSANGYNVSGVNPRAKTKDAYKSIKEVPYHIDAVDLCINPKSGIELVKEADELGIKHVLIQPGAESEEILSYCKEHGIEAVEGCALVELG
ncbi:CoA-binding protein [Clostridium zeae]|uniref:CoA-binding protein n=1 Tax=Clostridium zeae TaxID=2759022 RepID=A0ABQ1EFB9_9CLOT|nr:CoA-binding protein [Clostridium zeae]GFZ33366.1 CoA-binding protein [Clostridium zeae]